MLIGDSTELPITHTGSTTLNSSHKSFHLENVLCVSSMKRNLISFINFAIQIILPLNSYLMVFL